MRDCVDANLLLSIVIGCYMLRIKIPKDVEEIFYSRLDEIAEHINNKHNKLPVEIIDIFESITGEMNMNTLDFKRQLVAMANNENRS